MSTRGQRVDGNAPWQLVRLYTVGDTHAGPLLLCPVSPYVGPSSSCGLGAYSSACAASRPVVPIRNGLMKSAANAVSRSRCYGGSAAATNANGASRTELHLGRIVDRVRHDHGRGVVARRAGADVPAGFLDAPGAPPVRRPLETVGAGARRDDAPRSAARILQRSRAQGLEHGP